MQPKGISKQEALLSALLIAVLIWLFWYYFNYGQINLKWLFEF